MTGAPRFPPAPVGQQAPPRAPLRAMKGRSWSPSVGIGDRHARNKWSPSSEWARYRRTQRITPLVEKWEA